MAASTRKPELSWLNVLFCLLVVFIHVAAHPVSTLDKTSWQYLLVLIPQRLAFVSVPGFFLLSGVKLFLREDKPAPLLPYYVKRGKTVLLPYLIAVAVYYLYFVWRGYFSFSLGDLVRYWLLGNVSSHFYFVVALIQFILLVPLWRFVVRRYDPVLVLPFSLGLSWLCARHLGSFLALLVPGLEFPYSDRVCFTYLIYYLAGCYIGKNYDGFLRLLERNKTLIWFLFGFFTLGDSLLSALLFSGRAPVPYLEEVHIGYQMSGILFFFWLAARWKDNPLPRPVQALDSVSYLVYLYHGLTITLFQSLAARLGLVRIGTQFLLRTLFVYTVTIAAALIWRRATLWRKHFKKEGINHE